MSVVEAEIDIDAPIEEVFALAMDPKRTAGVGDDRPRRQGRAGRPDRARASR